MPQLSIHSPIGDLTLSEEDGALVSLDWGWSPAQKETPLLQAARRQLDRYFGGEPEAFGLPLAPAGTEFHRRVWRELSRIPYGETRTYGDVARALASGARAVGTACGRNPIPIIIPCHRVLGAGGALGGYSGDGGPETKQALLNLENPDLFSTQ